MWDQLEDGDWHIYILFFFFNFHFVLEDSRLKMLWLFQVNSKGIQSYIHMYPSSPKFPAHTYITDTMHKIQKIIRTYCIAHGTQGRGQLHGKESQKRGDICCCCLVTKPCPTLCDPTDRSPPGSSVHGVFQARTLEWVAIYIELKHSAVQQKQTQYCKATILQ